MKPKFILISQTAIMIWVASMCLDAQVLTPVEGLIVYKDTPRPCLVTNLDPEPKTLKKAWKKYLKQNYDIKLNGIGLFSNKDLLTAEEVIVLRIASGPIDIYTHITEDETGSEMKVFASTGLDVFVSMNNSPAAYNELKNIFQEFLKEYLPQYYQGRVRDTEHRVNELFKEREAFKKEITKDSEKIEKLKLEIEQLTLNLAANRAKLDLAESKLKKRKEKLERIRAQVKYF